MPQLQPMRVLVIEDDPDARENFRDILEMDGHHVELAGSVAETLDRDDWSSYAAIMLDWRLPDGTADTLLPRLRELAPGASVIVSTGTVGLSGAVTALRHGAADYILKPVEPDALRARLRGIVKQQRAERQLRLLNTAIGQLTEGVVVTDAELAWPGPRIVFVNSAMSYITGYSAEELLGQTPRVFQGQQTDRRELDRLKHELSAGRSYSGENVNYRKDGTPYPVELHVSPVADASGRVINYVSTHRDILDRKRTEERLIQAERLAAIGRAMAGLAHESRNALQRSQASLEMLRRRIEDRPDALELADRIQIAQDDLHRLYEEVREYAAPLRLNLRDCDLREILREAWEHLDVQRDNRNVQLRQHGDAGARCVVDRFALRQVFRNILDNALAACDDPLEIDVRFATTKYNGRKAVSITLRDNGPGFTPEVRERLFEEFFTTKTHGTGLGMAICKRFVEAHGGRITAGNHAGRGAEIQITLPRTQP